MGVSNLESLPMMPQGTPPPATDWSAGQVAQMGLGPRRLPGGGGLELEGKMLMFYFIIVFFLKFL